MLPPQNMEFSPTTKRCIKQRMVQNAFGLAHKTIRTTAPKITHRVLISAPRGSSGHTQDWIDFGKRTLPIGSKGCRCDSRGGGALASTFKPRLRLRQGPPSGMVLLMVADVLRLTPVTEAGLYGEGCLHKTWNPRQLLRAILSREWCKMHSVSSTRQFALQPPKSPKE